MFSLKTRGLFTFNKSVIYTNWSKINEGPLKKAGLLTRKIMRGSIRHTTSKKPSKPGKPPRSRHRHRPFKMIYSVPQPALGQVLIGHVGWGGKNQTPMQVHEFGETAPYAKMVYPKRKKRRMSKAQRTSARKKYLSGAIPSIKGTLVSGMKKYPERKFAQPALQKALPKLPGLWRNAFVKGK